MFDKVESKSDKGLICYNTPHYQKKLKVSAWYFLIKTVDMLN